KILGGTKMKTKIIVACGSGIATSRHVTMKIKEYLENRGYEVVVDSCGISELKEKQNNFDILLSTSKVSFKLDKPIINAVPILTGIGEEKVYEEIINSIES